MALTKSVKRICLVILAALVLSISVPAVPQIHVGVIDTRQDNCSAAYAAKSKAKTAKTKTTKTKTTVKASDADIKLLARLCQYEAGTHYNGSLAVANVVLNRVKSKKYPNTLNGVIFQRSQFGTLSRRNILPSRFPKPHSNCVKAAKAALNGKNNIGSRMSFRAARSVKKSNYKNYKIVGGNLFF